LLLRIGHLIGRSSRPYSISQRYSPNCKLPAMIERVGYPGELALLPQKPAAEPYSQGVVRTGEPLHGHCDQIFDGQVWRQSYETIVLPLSTNGSEVDMLIVGLIHNDEK
jgi:hypothetical protein